MDQQKEKTNSSKVKSPVKKNSKFTNHSSRESDKKRKKFMHDNFGKDEKDQLKKDDKKEREKCVITSRKKKKKDNKRKTPKRDNLDDSEKEQLRKYKKEGKKVMRHDLDDEKRSI